MRIWPFVLLLTACKSEPPADPPEEQPVVDEDTADTGTPVVDLTLRPAYFGMFAEFAIDADTLEAVPAKAYDTLGQPIDVPIRLVVVLADASLESGVITRDTACHVTLERAEPLQPASWVEAAGVWVGYELGPGDATVALENNRLTQLVGFGLDACSDKQMESIWGDDPADVVAKWRWGVGLQEITSQVQGQVQAQLSPEEWNAVKPMLLGGGLYADFLEPQVPDTQGYVDNGLAYAFEVDEEFRQRLDGTGNPYPIAKDVVTSGDNGLVTAMYQIVGGFLAPADLLLQ